MINIAKEVQDAKTIAISGHVRPDGDCVGSCLGIALYLEKRMPDARVDVFLEDFSDALKRNMAGADQIQYEIQTDVEQYDAFICMDCDCSRLGGALDIFKKAKKTINIDHHETNSGTGDVCYIVPKASSACELVYTVMDEEWIDEAIARDLYIGMVTDTGVFRYSNTGRKTMEIAGRLMEYGFDYTSIVREVFYEKTYIQQQILGRALLESFCLLDGKCIVSRIDRKSMKFYQATSKDMDGIASEMMNTQGVSCAIFMYEIQQGTFKVSLRSNGDVDVAKIASLNGGGGHGRAAGCTISASFYDIVNSMMPLIEEQLEAGIHV